ncbi:MAG: cell division protein ZapA [Spirochaetota bacterium]
MAVSTFRVELLGASFTVQTDATREHFEKLVVGLSERYDLLRQATNVYDPLKLAILAGITLSDDLERERGSSGDADKAAGELARITERLIMRIDESLAPPERQARDD